MEDPKKISGVKIQTFNYVMILVAVILYALLLYETMQTSSRYHALIDAEENYIRCEKAAAQVDEGSDILTEQSRLYVVTGESVYAKAYFQEACVDRKRETALEAISQLHPDDDVQRYLQSALNYSNDLMGREMYAMKLVSDARREDLDGLSEDMREIQLSSADQKLDAAGKIDKARELLFDAGYQNAKALVENNIAYCLDSSLSIAENVRVESADALKSSIQQQQIFITLLFMMNVIIFLFISVLVVKPLQIYIKCIGDNKTLEIVGSYEFKYLALTYNSIYDINTANEIMLRKKAERDALTGLMNRGAFEQLRSSMREYPIPITLLLIDVDEFKNVNDVYGHEVGDQVLQWIANLLNTTFRTTDFVARIGGDEFCVLMTETNAKIFSVVERKIGAVNQELQSGKDGLPKVSLSVGIASSDSGFDDTLYRRADIALYQVKRNGRCGCGVYSD